MPYQVRYDKTMSVFLTAEWRNLILVSYKVPDEVLQKYLPDNLHLDKLNGSAFVSLVAFDFINTKVKGMKMFFHLNFPEINLRFYVNDGKRRGVMFIREFVPKPIVVLGANFFFNENYSAAKMKSEITLGGTLKAKHEITYKGNYNFIEVETVNKSFMPGENSTEHFFKEHELGFVKSRSGKTNVYKVEHPFWQVYPIKKFNINTDFGKLYGQQFSFLNKQEPFNVTFAEGSNVKVFTAEKYSELQ